MDIFFESVDAAREKMLSRLSTMYKGAKVLSAFILAHAEQMADIEDVCAALYTERSLGNAVGEQLDRIGKAVGLDRYGQKDSVYRLLLWVKIGVNTSRGEPEQIIAIISQLTGGGRVHLQYVGNANLLIGFDGELDPEIEPFFRSFITRSAPRIAAGGVGIVGFTRFPAQRPFTFSGLNFQPDARAGGFSSVANPNDGGGFGGVFSDAVSVNLESR